MTDVIPGATSAQLEWVDAAGNSNFLTFDVVVSENWDNGATVSEHPVEIGADVGDHVRPKLITCQLKIRSSNEPIDANNWDQATIAPLSLTPATLTWVPASGIVIANVWNNPIELRALAASLVGLAGFIPGPGGVIAGGAGAIATGLIAGVVAPGFETDVPIPTDAGLLPPGPAGPLQPTVQQWPLGIDYVEKTHALLVQLRTAATFFNVFGSKQTQYGMVIEDLTFVRDANTGSGEDLTIGLKEVRVVTTQTVPVPIPNLSAGGGLKTVDHGGQDPTIAKKSLAVQAINATTAAIGQVGQLLGRL